MFFHLFMRMQKDAIKSRKLFVTFVLFMKCCVGCCELSTKKKKFLQLDAPRSREQLEKIRKIVVCYSVDDARMPVGFCQSCRNKMISPSLGTRQALAISIRNRIESFNEVRRLRTTAERPCPTSPCEICNAFQPTPKSPQQAEPMDCTSDPPATLPDPLASAGRVRPHSRIFQRDVVSGLKW